MLKEEIRDKKNKKVEGKIKGESHEISGCGRREGKKNAILRGKGKIRDRYSGKGG